MKNPFENLPLNTNRLFVQGVAISGCRVIIPITAKSEAEILQKQAELQNYLTNQYQLPNPIVA